MIRKTLVLIFSKIGLYHVAVALDTKIQACRERRLLRRYGMEALVQADRALREAGSFMFLASGTLLGAYRDKNFIAHDSDIDVGILADRLPENLPEILAKYGFKHEKQLYFKDTGLLTEDVYSYKRLHVDFFVYFKENDDFYYYSAKRHEHKTWQEANRTDGFPCASSWVSASEFEEIDFLGKQLFTPVKTPQWLEETYGSTYMTPIKNWGEKIEKTLRTRVKKETRRIYRRYFDE
jgi:phosphorylcholine metabolism protein LicD